MDLKKIENDLLDELEIDIVALHNVVRNFSGFERRPTDEDFHETMAFVAYFLDKHKEVLVLQGPELNEIEASNDEIINMLTTKWEEDKYDEMYYGIWFGIVKK